MKGWVTSLLILDFKSELFNWIPILGWGPRVILSEIGTTQGDRKVFTYLSSYMSLVYILV